MTTGVKLEQYVGNCEGCDKPMFFGDIGLICDDGPVLCAEHSPTWAQAKKQWDAGEQLDNDQDRLEAFMKSYAAHIAAGGSVDDKMAGPI
jgi:hypothetical protein